MAIFLPRISDDDVMYDHRLIVYLVVLITENSPAFVKQFGKMYA